MAEVTARKRGSKWEYRFEMAMSGGKRRQYSKGGFATKKEAMSAGTEMFARYNRAGAIFEPTELSVSDYLDWFYEHYCKKELSRNSQLCYEQMIRLYVKPILGKYKLVALKATICQEWLDDLAQKRLSKSTVKHIASRFKFAIAYAVLPCGFLESSPAQFLRVPKLPDELQSVNPHRVISPDEFSRIITAFPFGNRYHMVLMLGWCLGLRAGEATGLRWRDVDLENCTVTIDHQLVNQAYKDSRRPRADATFYMTSPKTRSSVRKIAFGPEFKSLLLREKERQENNSQDYGEYYYVQYMIDDAHGKLLYEVQRLVPTNLEPEDFICRDENGKWISYNSVKVCGRLIQKRLGIDFDYHSLRHTNATMLLDAGAEVKAVQSRLGHSSLSTTYETYIHSTCKMEQKAVEISDDFIAHVIEKAWTNGGQNDDSKESGGHLDSAISL